MPILKDAPAPAAAGQPPTKGGLRLSPVGDNEGERIIIYGTPKIGKTSLALNAPGKTVFFDLDSSLQKLKRAGDSMDNVQTAGVTNYEELLSALNSDGYNQFDSIVIDSATIAQLWATDSVIRNIPINKSGDKGNSIESFGFGKGYRHLYDYMDAIMMALENHVRAGRNAILICHQAIRSVPNPQGEDFICYTPDMFETKQVSFKNRAESWADHILFISYDVTVKESKGTSGGSRTIYTQKLPMLTAGSRTIKDPYVIYEPGGAALWKKMFNRA